jgi:hypothetical protein
MPENSENPAQPPKPKIPLQQSPFHLKIDNFPQHHPQFSANNAPSQPGKASQFHTIRPAGVLGRSGRRAGNAQGLIARIGRARNVGRPIDPAQHPPTRLTPGKSMDIVFRVPARSSLTERRRR